MSKKLAEGLTGLVLDVKRGSGAFLPEVERGIELAQMMASIGHRHRVPVVALLTAMDRPWAEPAAMPWNWRSDPCAAGWPPDLMRSPTR
jgi:thymidine phosphorylase